MREDDERGAVAEKRGYVLGGGPLDRVALEPAELVPASGREALDHVAVGRELVSQDDDLGARAIVVERGGDELVQAHGGRVGDNHLPRRRSHERADEVAEANR